MPNIRNKKAVSISQCHKLVIQYVIMKKKKKKRKKERKERKENLEGSEQNVVGVKEIAQG